MTKVLLYTAVFGGYDRIQPVSLASSDVDVIAFTDKATEVPKGWEKVLVDRVDDFSDRKMNRMLKMVPEQLHYTGDYDALIYLDGSMNPRPNLVPAIVEMLQKREAVMLKHPERERVDQEIEACVKLGKLSKQDADRIGPMVLRNNGPLLAGGFFARLQENGLGKVWWSLCVSLDCWRDQLTLPRAVWFWDDKKRKLRTLNINVWKSPYWKFRGHGS